MMTTTTRQRAGRNQTLTLNARDITRLSKRLLQLSENATVDTITNRTIAQNLFDVVEKLPDHFVDLLFIDPPYNLSKEFNGNKFRKMGDIAYEEWVDSWLSLLVRLLKPTASVYVCADWQSSSAVHRTMLKYFTVRSRITWEREKGRGALSNWKNCSEDIWFGTVSDRYFFNPHAVKLKRKVIAPYKVNGKPKDWVEDADGDFRLTHPSNLWSDITIPFWSMPENTDHPTQKPEKLIAKVILASSKEGDFVFDPFLGSGTTSVVAKKLGGRYSGVELDKEYSCWAERRIEIAETDKSIQGYAQGVFWERNSLANQQKK